MYVFLDDSGPFAIQGQREKNINCVVAVIMNDAAYDQWKSRYMNLPKASDIKDIKKAEEVIRFLVNIGARAFIVLTDVVLYGQDRIIEEHRLDYLSSIESAYANKGFDGTSLIMNLNALGLDLYLKACLFTRLSSNVIRDILTIDSLSYDVKTLVWCNDNLSKPILREVIRELLLVDLSERSKIDPIHAYSNNIAEWLSPCGRYVDIPKLRAQYNFISEQQEPGIKAADCLANFLRREALFGNFFDQSPLIWLELSRIFNLSRSRDCVSFDKNIPFFDVSNYSESMISFFNYNI